MQVELRPIEVRALELSDLDSIMVIEPRAYGSHHWSRQSFISELTNPSGHYLGAVCTEDSALLGYTGYWLIGDEAHITTLAVHPDFRRERVGERLLIANVLDARANGALWLTLEVRVSNEAAQGLYFKYGFRNLGVRRRYYQDNSEDALVLWTDRITDVSFAEQFAAKAAAMGDYSKKAIMKELLADKHQYVDNECEFSKLASA